MAYIRRRDHAYTRTPGHMLAHKRLVTVTLDIMCYDDLELEDIDWRYQLGLEGDEDVYTTIKEFDMGD